jgi:membrane associated rhomboid family serine protease
MGFYDREYYREETRGSGWLTGVTPACNTIILINVVVFVLQQVFDPHSQSELVRDYLLASSDGVFHHGRVWQLLTATFLHAGVGHILWNMWFFWMVGREMESFYGTRDFVAMYLGAAIVSTLGYVLVDEFSPAHPLGLSTPMLGASGAVMAVVVLYALYYPHRQILLFFIVPVEMWLHVVIYLSFQLWQFLQPGAPVKEAVASHLTGALYGYLFKQFDLRWSRLSWKRMRRPRLRIVTPDPREKPLPRSSGSSWSSNPPTAPKPSSAAVVVPEEQLDARLDEVLAKIAREGREGLTEEEKGVLQEASRRARNRRSDRL